MHCRTFSRGDAEAPRNCADVGQSPCQGGPHLSAEEKDEKQKDDIIFLYRFSLNALFQNCSEQLFNFLKSKLPRLRFPKSKLPRGPLQFLRDSAAPREIASARSHFAPRFATPHQAHSISCTVLEHSA